MTYQPTMQDQLRALSIWLLDDDTDLRMPAGMIDPAAAADMIDTIIAEVERLRMALKPFAEEAGQYDPDEGDDEDSAWGSRFTIGDLRRARAALTVLAPEAYVMDSTLQSPWQ